MGFNQGFVENFYLYFKQRKLKFRTSYQYRSSGDLTIFVTFECPHRSKPFIKVEFNRKHEKPKEIIYNKE